MRTRVERASIRVHFFSAMTPQEIAPLLVAMGCPPEKAPEMAAQLDKRARQLAEAKGRSYEDSLAHLLGLMRQGWSAKARSCGSISFQA